MAIAISATSCVPLQIQENVDLSRFTTLHVGGPARFFVAIPTEAQLLQALDFAREHALPVFVLGGGSNLLISDDGFYGLVLHLILNGPIERRSVGPHLDLTVPAGVPWDDVVLAVCQEGLSGMECLAGIPGLTGGSPIQNIGAYGQEVADTILRVRVCDLQAAPGDDPFLDLDHDACRFSYRSSVFNGPQRGRYIITSVTFRLSPATRPNLSYADVARHFADRLAGDPPSPLEVYHAIREIRRAKGMLLVEGDPDCASAGSFFKNPIVPTSSLDRIAAELQLNLESIPRWPATAEGHVKIPAAWLLERSGFTRGFILGRTGISSRHTLALINRGGATGGDFVVLRDLIRNEVSRRLGIDLEQEPVEPGAGTRLSRGL